MALQDNIQPCREGVLEEDRASHNMNGEAKSPGACTDIITDKSDSSVTKDNESELIPTEDLDAIVDIFRTLIRWDEESKEKSEAA